MDREKYVFAFMFLVFLVLARDLDDLIWAGLDGRGRMMGLRRWRMRSRFVDSEFVWLCLGWLGQRTGVILELV